MLTQKIEIWAGRRDFPRKAQAVQQDSARTLTCLLMDVTPPEGATARFYAKKPSGKQIYNNASVSGNTVTVDLTNQALAEAGILKCQIELLDAASKRLTSFAFDIDVQATLITDDAIQSMDQSEVLDEKIAQAEKSAKAAKESETKAAASQAAAEKAQTGAKAAQSASEKARDDAVLQANAAKDSASAASASQSEAAKSAKEAADSASAAGTSASAASKAQSGAEAAQKAALAAQTAAEAAQSKAEAFRDDAGAQAASAKSDADSAEAAKTAAEAARDAAKAAKTAAETAKTDAATQAEKAAASAKDAALSQSAASESKAAAAKAQTAAEAAQKKAEAAQTGAQAAQAEAEEFASYAEEKAAAAGQSQAAADAAKDAAVNAQKSAESAKTDAASQATKAASSASAADTSAKAAADSQSKAAASEAAAAKAQTAAETAQASAEKWEKLSESYAHGVSKARENEDTDNASYYYLQAKQIAQGLSGALRPMGTIAFSELSGKKENATPGDMYNISDAFTSDDTFADGGNRSYGAGSNVYLTSGNKWDVLAGTVVSGVKGSAESTYRQGNVSLTAANVGAAAASHTHKAADIADGNTEWVPSSRKVNSKALSADITLTASDVGAASASHTHLAKDVTNLGALATKDALTAEDVGAVDTKGGTMTGPLKLQGGMQVWTAKAKSGTAGYLKIGKLEIADKYVNSSISFAYGQRRAGITHCEIHFIGSGTTNNPSLDKFYYYGCEISNKKAVAPIWMVHENSASEDNGVWTILVQKQDAYETVDVVDFYYPAYMHNVTVTWMDEWVETLPEGAVRAAIHPAYAPPTPDEIGAAAKSHTHNYAGSDTDGGKATSAAVADTAKACTGNAATATTASKVANTLTFAGAISSTYNGSSAVTVTIPKAPAVPTEYTAAEIDTLWTNTSAAS